MIEMLSDENISEQREININSLFSVVKLPVKIKVQNGPECFMVNMRLASEGKDHT